MANDPKESKKDLTGILDLQKLQAENPEVMAEVPVDPFAVNELQAIEQVDEFQSIDQIGMMDHPEPQEVEAAAPPPEDPFQVTPAEPAPTDDPFAVNVDQGSPAPGDDPFSIHLDAPSPAPEQPFEAAANDFSNPIPDKFSITSEPENPAPVEPAPNHSMSNLKNYSEKSQGKTSVEVKIHYPFHLKINGTFGPYERDKLLLFITDNPIGLSSSELDLQITSGRVFLPRISEYAAIKLVQELRDSGLSFRLHPSDREGNETTNPTSSLSFHYQNSQNNAQTSTLLEIPVLNSNAMPNPGKPFREIDEVSVVQYVRTEMLEVENSPMIQEVIERMTEALKQKARLKGGNALLSLKQEITPLRLPSQYQISLKASVILIDQTS